MGRRLAPLLLLACLASAAWGRSLLAPTPTEKLNAEKQRQTTAAAQAAAAKAPPAKRLKAPCFVPVSACLKLIARCCCL